MVPYITETDNAGVWPFYDEGGYKQYKKEHDGSSLLEIGVDFEHDDISYVIVEKVKDIKETRKLVGEKTHIFTKDEIMENVVGVDYHDEILSTPEQLDYEAAQRHAARLAKMAKEIVEEKWGKKEE